MRNSGPVANCPSNHLPKKIPMSGPPASCEEMALVSPIARNEPCLSRSIPPPLFSLHVKPLFLLKTLSFHTMLDYNSIPVMSMRYTLKVHMFDTIFFTFLPHSETIHENDCTNRKKALESTLSPKHF